MGGGGGSHIRLQIRPYCETTTNSYPFMFVSPSAYLAFHLQMYSESIYTVYIQLNIYIHT
jgi:hypothetical protein